jgi:predicted nucleic acid-binding protein
MFLLDTNVVSELRKVRAGKANLQVARWAYAVEAARLYISAVTVLELELGVLLLETPGHHARRGSANLAGESCAA